MELEQWENQLEKKVVFQPRLMTPESIPQSHGDFQSIPKIHSISIHFPFGDGSKPWYLVNPKIAGKWMFIPLKMY